jgi:proteasome lid subunit RPN8/RPN11
MDREMIRALGADRPRIEIDRDRDRLDRDVDREPVHEHAWERDHDSARIVILPHSVRARLVRWARAGYPRETCGLLVGSSDATTTRVIAATRARNLDRERAHERFELDPRDLLATDRAARAEGRDIVGVWHSHPDHSAEPSDLDRRAAWNGWSYLIVAVTTCGASEMRSWRLAHDRFVEETLHRSARESLDSHAQRVP